MNIMNGNFTITAMARPLAKRLGAYAPMHMVPTPLLLFPNYFGMICASYIVLHYDQQVQRYISLDQGHGTCEPEQASAAYSVSWICENMFQYTASFSLH